MKYHRIITLKNGQEALLRNGLATDGEAGYKQLELDVVADNERAISMYQKAGFIEYGRNPYGFCSRTNGFQELILMRKEL